MHTRIQQHTIFHKEIDVDLLKSKAHAGALDIGEHDKLNVCRRFVVVKLVLIGPVGDEAECVLSVNTVSLQDKLRQDLPIILTP